MGVAGGGNKHAAGAVFVFHVRGDIILYLDVVPLSETHMALDSLGHTHNPLPQIQLVGALVQKNAAAFAGPGSAPVAGIVIALRTIPGGNNPDCPADLTIFPGVNQFTHLAVYMIGALVKHHAKDNFRMLFGFFVHLADLFGIDACRLLAHHMKAPLHAFNGIFGMIIMRHADVAGIDQAGVQHFDRIIKIGDVPGEVFLRPCNTVGVDVGYSNELNIGALSRKYIAGMAGTHVSDPDDAKSYFLFH